MTSTRLVCALAALLCAAGCRSLIASPCDEDDDCAADEACAPDGFCDTAGRALRDDAGSVPHDAGSAPDDAGRAPNDAGNDPGNDLDDAGNDTDDAGNAPVDAGNAPVDARFVVADAGFVLSDGGHPSTIEITVLANVLLTDGPTTFEPAGVVAGDVLVVLAAQDVAASQPLVTFDGAGATSGQAITTTLRENMSYRRYDASAPGTIVIATVAGTPAFPMRAAVLLVRGASSTGPVSCGTLQATPSTVTLSTGGAPPSAGARAIVGFAGIDDVSPQSPAYELAALGGSAWTDTLRHDVIGKTVGADDPAPSDITVTTPTTPSVVNRCGAWFLP